MQTSHKEVKISIHCSMDGRMKTDTRHLTGFLGQQYQTIEDNSEDGEQTEDMDDDTRSAPEWSIDSESEHEL